MQSYDESYSPHSPPAITVVITSFKDQGLILNCVESVLRSRNPKPEIVVVDCMSRDLRRIINERYKDSVHLIQLNSDVGVAEQRNIGFRNCAGDSKFVLFLDNDTEVEADAIRRLAVAAEQDSRCSILQPRIVSCSDRAKTLEMGLTSNIFGIPKPNRVTGVEPFFASGSGMLVRNDVLHATGGFDPTFYFGAEELDLIWRARLLGHRIRTVPEAVVYHKTEGTRKRLSADRLYLGLRNTIRMQLKNYDCPLNLLITSLFIVRSLIESVVLLFVSRVLGGFKSNVANIAVGETKFPSLATKFLNAVLWNVKNLKDTFLQHSRIQLNRTVPDTAILSAMKKNDLIYVSPAYQLGRHDGNDESLP